jgi:hypothetical protein
VFFTVHYYPICIHALGSGASVTGLSVLPLVKNSPPSVTHETRTVHLAKNGMRFIGLFRGFTPRSKGLFRRFGGTCCLRPQGNNLFRMDVEMTVSTLYDAYAGLAQTLPQPPPPRPKL